MYYQILLKTLCIYFIILIVMKFMGKREIGQLSLFDFIVLLLIADVAVLAIDEDNNFVQSLIPIFALVIIQKILAYLVLKIPFFRQFFDGKESILINNGVLDLKEMKKQCYNIDDLMPILRLKNIRSLSEVKYLIAEPDGEISIFKYIDEISNTNDFIKNNIVTNINNKDIKNSVSVDCFGIFPVITSGKLNKDNIKLLNLDEEWIIKEVSKQGYTVDKVYYASYEKHSIFILKVK